MEASAKEYASGPAGYNAYSAGFLCGESIVLQRGVRDLNSDSSRAYLDAYTLVPTKGPEAALDTSALEAAEMVLIAKQIAAEIGDSEEVHNAAAKLQAMQRKKLAKKEAERKKEEKRIAEEIGDSEEVHTAASKLQAVHRGRRAKKEVASLRAQRLQCGLTSVYRAVSAGPAAVISKAVKMDVSPSGNKTLVLRNDKDKPVVELLHRPKPVKTDDAATGEESAAAEAESPYDFHLDASAFHGRILGDGWFAAGGSAFSPDERYAVYVACDKQHSCGGDGGNGSSGSGTGGPSYFDTKVAKKNRATNSSIRIGSKFEHTDDWGEKYIDVHATVLCVLDCFTGQVG